MTTSDPTILLTGATSGLGQALATTLATNRGRLILHGRNPKRLQALREKLAGATAQIDVVQADLAELSQVAQLGDDVAELTDQLDVVVHNAGVGKGATDTREVSADGYELRLAVNHLAPFALTNHLLPLLEAGAPSRVVNVASGAQTPIDFDDPQLTQHYLGNRAYAQSKFAMVAAGFKMARTLAPEVVTVNSLHPATLMPTRMVHEGYGRTVDDLQTGVDAVMQLIVSPKLTGVSGQYFSIQQLAQAHPKTYDIKVQDRLWELSESLAGVRY